jgi:uncharacterized protein
MPELYLSDTAGRQRRGLLGFLVIIAIALLLGSRYIASTLIDYAWWGELGQRDTWFALLWYRTGPVTLVIILYWVSFVTAFQFGSRRQTGLRSQPRYLKQIAVWALLFVALIAANVTVDNWTAVRFFGGARLSPGVGGFVDPVFGRPLHFYLFQLPFYRMLLHIVLAGALISMAVFWLSANFQDLTDQLPSVQGGMLTFNREPRSWQAFGASDFARMAIVLVLLSMAGVWYLDRYGLLLQDHGTTLVGVDWTADHIVLPLQWLLIFGAIAAAALVALRRARLAIPLLLLLPVRFILPSLVAGVYVRPNELALERPYIQHHIDATRAAYGLNSHVKETTLQADNGTPIDFQQHRPLLDNVRLWDWRAFHDTVSQIQPLRPYIYYDTDVDRYTIDGQLRQVLIAPRELDVRQLGTSANWINSHLIYTHGYGLVLAEANHITTDGLPVLFVKDAPPEVTTQSIALKTPEIYYSELASEPVYVSTKQAEFNYPSGSESNYTKYKGSGGFPIDSLLMRLSAALTYGDLNLLLTNYLESDSRMMIRRRVEDRLSTVAGFLTWDPDPYLVISANGQPVWIVDGYTTSDSHPYSRSLELADTDVNYIRNAVKATVNAYTGEVNLYVFDPNDVLIASYSKLFPHLFKPSSAMPSDLREHARYPELLFSAQAEIYRTFHMRDPEAFYNRADLWDLAKTGTRSSEAGSSSVSPTYVVAALPGESRAAEFMLITVFTPANKDNLIGFMAARCDGAHLGELVFVQLSKQNIVYGPMQIDARISQDSTISKDLTLWNQQGSQVLRGQTLVLPIANRFLYVEPIYIQASQASMPQLKKVALALGNTLAYADTYEQALAQLIGELTPNASAQETTSIARPSGSGSPATSATSTSQDSEARQKLIEIRDHLTRYRELSSQGKWAEAGRELDAIQSVAGK